MKKHKLFLIFFLAISVIGFSQEDNSNNPSIELPDFVIVGKQTVSVKKVKKIPPDFVSSISDEFIKPSYSADELKIQEVSAPNLERINIFDSTNVFFGSLELGIGLYSLPVGSISHLHPFEGGFVRGKAGGNYQRAFDENTERYSLNGGLDFSYIFPDNINFIPGSHISLGTEFKTNTFKLFAADDPKEKRTINSGNLLFKIQNLASEDFIYKIQVQDEITNLSQETFTENYLSLNGAFKFQSDVIELGILTKFDRQFYSDSTDKSQDNDLISIRPFLGIKLGKAARVRIGFTFARSESEKSNKPYASASIRFNDQLSLFAEYEPDAILFTAGKMLRENDYFNPQIVSAIPFIKENSFNVSLKYEYDIYFQLTGGIKYFSSTRFPYFLSSNLKGRFEIAEADAKSITAYFDALYHLGPYGAFYGSLEFNDIREKSTDNFIPYKPIIKSSLHYTYYFSSAFNAEANLTFHSARYIDLDNNVEISPYLSPGVKLNYNFSRGFLGTLELTNLSNSSNYLWKEYKGMPFNLILGVNYNW
jgi:hypothetical protein